jgi:hypothetical protein
MQRLSILWKLASEVTLDASTSSGPASGRDTAQGVWRSAMLLRVVAFVLLTGVASAAEGPQLPTAASTALGPAVADAVKRFNASEERLRAAPQVQSDGPAGEPYLLRATYRQATPDYAILKIEGGTRPVVTARVRAVEFEKRATNVNNRDVRAEFERAPWQQTPRGFVLDFRFQWSGTEWKQLGAPVANPTLGVVGRMSLLGPRRLAPMNER